MCKMGQGLSDSLRQRLIFKFLLIVKTPETTFKRVRIKSEDGAGQPLWQDGPSTKIWRTALAEKHYWHREMNTQNY